MPYEDRLVVLALHQRDADEWKREHPELADDARIIIAGGKGWEALRGILPTAIALAPMAASDASVAGSEPPRHIRLALEVAEHRRPHILKQVA